MPGTITANYDGVRKHRTTIGDGAFIGVGHHAPCAGDHRRRLPGPAPGPWSPTTCRRASSPWASPHGSRAPSRRGGRSGRCGRAVGGDAAHEDTSRSPAVRRRGPDPPGATPREPANREILFLIVLTILEGFFVAAEIALVIDPAEPRGAAGRRGEPRARAASGASIDDPGRFLAVIQLGLTFIGFLAVGLRGREPDAHGLDRASSSACRS